MNTDKSKQAETPPPRRPACLFNSSSFFHLCLSVFICGYSSSPLSAQTVQHGLRVPAGFEVTEVADSSLANDIYTMTFDPKGRVVVAGRGYIRLLVDRDGDGRADSAVEVADGPKDGAMGL